MLLVLVHGVHEDSLDREMPIMASASASPWRVFDILGTSRGCAVDWNAREHDDGNSATTAVLNFGSIAGPAPDLVRYVEISRM
jgi:hypothetical protein